MSPELEGFAAAVAQIVEEACAAVRADFTQRLEAVARDAESVGRALEQRAERAEAQSAQLQRDLDVMREQAALSPITAALMDASGVLHVVMRSGDRFEVRVADFDDLVAARVSDALGEAELRFVARMDSQFAGALQRLGDAPRWTRTAVYRAGTVVSFYSGRTYVVRAGVPASMGQEPGEHPEVWERIGSHGIRVMKSRPENLEPGDVFTEGESRFIFDGETITLLVPRALKQSDLDRFVKPQTALGQSNADRLTAIERRFDALEPRLDRTERAANDAQAWIVREGDEAVMRSAQALAWQENRAAFIDSPALQRIVDRADDIDTMLDQGTGS
jgi:hypothetical protein